MTVNQIYLPLYFKLIKDVVPIFNTALDGIFWVLFQKFKGLGFYLQEVLKIFIGVPASFTFDVD